MKTWSSCYRGGSESRRLVKIQMSPQTALCSSDLQTVSFCETPTHFQPLQNLTFGEGPVQREGVLLAPPMGGLGSLMDL